MLTFDNTSQRLVKGLQGQVCAFRKRVSDFFVFRGSLPNLTSDDDTLNGCMPTCPRANHVGFGVDFLEKPNKK